MSISVPKLRRLLLAGALLLTAALASFVGIARYKARHFLRDLPARLGADIKSETNGFTYSQSVKGQTLFTLHASKAIQRQNGKATLHDVSIELYGRTKDEQKRSRTDRISGAEFEYDQPTGLVRAAGEVHIDLQTPAGETAHDPHGENDGRIHMKTSGLVFDQKAGIANTDQPIEFHLNDAQGTAVGAQYDSRSGVLVLKRDVHLRRESGGKISVLDASSATIDRVQHLAELQNARYAENGQTLHATTMFIDLDESGSPTRMRGEGVQIADASGSTIAAPRGVAEVGADHRVHGAQLSGGVQYASDTARGQAREAKVTLAESGLQSAEFTGEVYLRDEANGSARELAARTVTLAQAADSTRQIVATGSARWTATGVDAMQISADRLRATIAGETTGGTLGGSVRHVRAEGHSILEQQLGNGVTRRTAADTIDIALKPSSTKPAKTGRKSNSAAQIDHAVEEGSVSIVEHQPADAKQHRAASDTRAYAARAELVGATNLVTLTGAPRVESAGTLLSADRIALNQITGDATAEGSVKGSLASAGAQEGTHIIAARAELHRSSDLALFYGSGSDDARLWQGNSQIIAPRIELQQGKQQLRGYSTAGHAVRAVLPMSEGTRSSTPQAGGKAKMFAGAVRITAMSLVYDGAAAHPVARLGGGVRLLQTAGTISARDVVVTFKPQAKSQKATNAMPAGELEQVRAEGDVRLAQPGRSGTGSLLVYTAAKDEFALTGTPTVPPHIIDSERGSITGDSLLFHAGDDSVIVAATPGKRVHTETRVDR